MKAQELRIGNYVKSANGIWQIAALSIDGIEAINRGDTCVLANSVIIQPIEITEEWLLKFGFELRASLTYRVYVLIEGDRMYKYVLDKDEKDNSCFQYLAVKFDCLYVHQLQNVYFALTGNELENKPLKSTTEQICYKTNKVCHYDCGGLCKDS